MDATLRSRNLSQAVEEVRAALEPVLTRVQDLEVTTEGVRREQVMEISHRLAGVIGVLFGVARAPGSDVVPTARECYEKLELTMQLMDLVPDVRDEQRQIARALALLFALGAGPRSSCPPPRRSSTGMAAVLPEKHRSPPSAPSIELGEIDAGELGLEGGTEDPPASERRVHPRIAFEVEVGFVSETHFYAGISMDVSTGGLFVATYRVQPVGSIVGVTFVLPNGHAVTTDALVRWVRQPGEEASPGMGLAFDLSGEDLRQVESFCERRQPLFIDMD